MKVHPHYCCLGFLHVGENVSVGGTLTYEDVTNIDSVGLITAQTGVKVTAGGIDITAGGLDVSAGISTFGGGDIQISGSAAGVSSVTWDASADSLIFKDKSYAKFGDGSVQGSGESGTFGTFRRMSSCGYTSYS